MIHFFDAGGRPVDTLLAEYAAGSLSRPLHVLVAAHLTLQPRSRAYVEALDILKGDELAATAPVPVADRDAKLAAIFAEPPVAVAPAAPADDLMPGPLRAFVGRSGDDIPWKTRLPGIRQHVIGTYRRHRAQLIMVKPGGALPAHTHEGQEVTLVLQGQFHDASGVYRRGDICMADETVNHRPVADAAEGCICFIVSDGPFRLTGRFGRIVEWLSRR
ncbi:ChrR family anti-sigma-E factor [Phreatobacter stygius]|uniref:Transcriptional regulator n=1 Tax=Phreatobacter stygius TaxID=1940610 RepID=A0A4D7BEC4_9HYPH|nr:ChrR family anti-sigma-E factor [Phreatobacter stygius]QCI68823.1 transcriptional regulator [Phreatobacter stygius]